ncbi:MAG: twin-arginine translocase subunit TatC [Lysobacter sp.]|nr:twin-arginine translocase subunit TatC [Lysobacter sp.]
MSVADPNTGPNTDPNEHSDDPGADSVDVDASEGRLIDHLIELRARLIRGLVLPVLLFLTLVPFSGELFDWLVRPLLAELPAGSSLNAYEVMSAFMAPVKLAFFVALFATMPWLLYQAWAFVAPGLYRREKRLALPILVSALLLFYAGCAFAFFVVLQGVFGFLVRFAPDVVKITPDPTKYLDFVVVIFFAFGFCFELPVALVIMVLLGWVTPKQLGEWRGYAIVAIFFVAAVVTPPDVLSQLMLAIPMCVLYEVGILAAKLIGPKRSD